MKCKSIRNLATDWIDSNILKRKKVNSNEISLTFSLNSLDHNNTVAIIFFIFILMKSYISRKISVCSITKWIFEWFKFGNEDLYFDSIVNCDFIVRNDIHVYEESIKFDVFYQKNFCHRSIYVHNITWHFIFLPLIRCISCLLFISFFFCVCLFRLCFTWISITASKS